MTIRVQKEPFAPATELEQFLARVPRAGGVASFIGQVRDFKGRDRASGETITAMTLEHYPGMAERELEAMAADAKARWHLDDVVIIHRSGALSPGEAIVFVATAAAHRAEAFAACEFLVDWLKTKAPFWKKETTAAGAQWVEAAAADDTRAERWKA